MKQFVRGQKSKLSSLTPATTLEVGVQLSFASFMPVKLTCFGVDIYNHLSDQSYFILYDQQRSPEGAVQAIGMQGDDQQRFRVDLARLPSSIRKLVFTATLEGACTMGAVNSGYLRLLAQGREVARFPLRGADFKDEKAVILGELYFKSVWRFAAVGQGFNGGLSALLEHFGASEAIIPPPPPPPQPRLSLGKITLEKKGDKQALTLQKGDGQQPIHINLNWDNPNTSWTTRLFSLSGQAPDLDLGCMYRLANRNRGVIQPLGKNFGARSRAPYIYLDKDDRSGAAADGENLYIYRPDLIDTVMVFAMIYEGARDFTSVNGRMTIRDQAGSEIFIRLNNPDPNRTFCAICTIKKVGSRVVITKEERYFGSHREADNHYGFGFQWRRGTKA